MTRWIIGLLIFITLILAAAYAIVPGDLTISSLTAVRANPDGAYRCLTDHAKWQHLFGKPLDDSEFKYGNAIFKINRQLEDGVEVTIKTDDSIISIVELLRINKDSSALRWTANIRSSSNPLSKIVQFFRAKRMKNTLDNMLGSMKSFLENESNIYGFQVQRSLVKDTLLITTKKTFEQYPSTEDIYSMIHDLEEYADKHGARQTDFPMLNIRATHGYFEVMTALPVDRELPDQGAIQHKEMVPGNILVAEITGGPYTVSKAFINLQNYVDDLDLQSPAIPFQSLVTDRSKEPDSSHWHTRIYFPIY